MFTKIVPAVICNDRTGECHEFTGPWPIRVLLPWFWWMFL